MCLLIRQKWGERRSVIQFDLLTFACIKKALMLKFNVHSLTAIMASIMMVWSASADAQTYQGRRAGTVSTTGSSRKAGNCNMAGSVFQKLDKNFRSVNGGQCIMNGSRFDLLEAVETTLGPTVPLDEMDLRNSSWVAVDFWTPPSLRGTDASQANFSAIHNDGEAVEMVDATGLIATKAMFHGAQMASWWVQGSVFDGADFRSSILQLWTTNEESYSDYELLMSAAEFRGLSAVKATFENCLIEDCNFSGGDFTSATFSLTKFSGDESAFNGANFANSVFDRSQFSEADVSGANFSGAKMDGCTFENCNMTGGLFKDVMIKDCRFISSMMRGLSFEGAMVMDCDFDGIDLSKCNLTDATFKNLKSAPSELPSDYMTEAIKMAVAPGDTTIVFNIVEIKD